MVTKGGNQRFFDYLDHYDLNAKEIPEKYKSNAASFYRRRLYALA